MFSFVGRAVGNLLEWGRKCEPPPPCEDEILSELPSVAITEKKTLYGVVTDMKEDYGLVDGR